MCQTVGASEETLPDYSPGEINDFFLLFHRANQIAVKGFPARLTGVFLLPFPAEREDFSVSTVAALLL